MAANYFGSFIFFKRLRESIYLELLKIVFLQPDLRLKYVHVLFEIFFSHIDYHRILSRVPMLLLLLLLSRFSCV